MTIFVNPTSASNGVGTVLDPKNTWDSMSFSGDVDFAQCAGTTFTATGANGISVTTGGSAVARKTIRSYEPQTGDVTDKKAFIRGNGSTTRYGINLQANVGYITVQDFDISMIGDGSNANNGITASVSPANDAQLMEIIIQRCEIHDLLPSSAADVNGVNLRGARNIVRNCGIWSIPTDGISAHGQFLSILENRIDRINTDGRNQADCVHLTSDTTGLVIMGNYLDASAGANKQVIIVNGSTGAGGLIMGNYLIGGASLQQCIYTDVHQDIIGNVIVDGIYGVRAAGASTISGNVFFNRRSTGTHFGIWLEADGSLVCNNTMICLVGRVANQRGIYCEIGDSGHTIRNNIITGYSVGVRLDEGAGQTENYNVIFDVDLPIQGISANPALGSMSKDLDPFDYIEADGRLKSPYLIDNIPMLNPVGAAGAYLQGVRLMGGARLDPRRPVVGAFPEGRY